MFKYLSYISEQSHILKDSDLQVLLTNCRKNNTENGISGLLISYQGSFIQFIEGDEEIIDQLFDRIKEDPRHHSVTELASGYEEERQFNEWSMAFKKLDENEAENILGYRILKKEKVFLSSDESENHPAVELLNSFVNNL